MTTYSSIFEVDAVTVRAEIWNANGLVDARLFETRYGAINWIVRNYPEALKKMVKKVGR